MDEEVSGLEMALGGELADLARLAALQLRVAGGLPVRVEYIHSQQRPRRGWVVGFASPGNGVVVFEDGRVNEIALDYLRATTDAVDRLLGRERPAGYTTVFVNEPNPVDLERVRSIIASTEVAGTDFAGKQIADLVIERLLLNPAPYVRESVLRLLGVAP